MKKMLIVSMVLVMLILAGCSEGVVKTPNGSEDVAMIRRAELTDREEMLLNSVTNVRELYLVEVENLSEYTWVNIYVDVLTTEGLENYTNTGSMIDKEEESFLIVVNLGQLGENNQASWGVAKLTDTGYSKYTMEMEDPYRSSTLSSVVNEKEYLDGKKNIFLTVKATYGNEILSPSVDHIQDISELSVKDGEVIYIFSFELQEQK